MRGGDFRLRGGSPRHGRGTLPGPPSVDHLQRPRRVRSPFNTAFATPVRNPKNTSDNQKVDGIPAPAVVGPDRARVSTQEVRDKGATRTPQWSGTDRERRRTRCPTYRSQAARMMSVSGP